MTVFVNDTFTESSDVDLTSHTGETGAMWTLLSGTDDAQVSAANDNVFLNSSKNVEVYASGTPGSAEYDVEVDIGGVATNSYYGVTGRSSTLAVTYYHARIQYNTIRLYKAVSGSFTLLGQASGSYGTGPYTLKLEIRDGAKKVYVDGSEKISSTNNDITDAGKAGMRLYAASTISTTVDNFTATDVESGVLPNKLIIQLEDNIVSFVGKKINTGSVSMVAGSATLEKSGNEGLNASLSSILDPNALSSIGSKGLNASLSSILGENNFLSSGVKGNTGELSTIIDLVVSMLGFEADVIFSGVLNMSLDSHEVSTLGLKGNTGVIDTQIQNLINFIVGIKGNTGKADINVFTESQLFAKLGTTGQLNILLADLDVRMIEVTVTDEIFTILVSMKTGQITILGPKTGTINIERLS